MPHGSASQREPAFYDPLCNTPHPLSFVRLQLGLKRNRRFLFLFLKKRYLSVLELFIPCAIIRNTPGLEQAGMYSIGRACWTTYNMPALAEN